MIPEPMTRLRTDSPHAFSFASADCARTRSPGLKWRSFPLLGICRLRVHAIVLGLGVRATWVVGSYRMGHGWLALVQELFQEEERQPFESSGYPGLSSVGARGPCAVESYTERRMVYVERHRTSEEHCPSMGLVLQYALRGDRELHISALGQSFNALHHSTQEAHRFV